MASNGFSQFAGAVAVVTGGSSGIGKGIAEALIARGTNVVIAARDLDKLERSAGEIGATAMAVDVADPASVDALRDRVLDRFGKVNILCNNAGVGPMASMRDLTLGDWRWMLGINLMGVIHGLASFLPHILANDEGGQIVNTASLAGLWPVPNLGAYGAAKAGVISLTENLHLELSTCSERVGATVLCPGPVRSELKSSLRHRAAGETGGLKDVDIANIFPPEVFLEPAQCGDFVIDAIEHNHLYILTHPELGGGAERKFAAMSQAFDRMRAMMARHSARPAAATADEPA